MIKFIFPLVASITILGLILLITSLPTPNLDLSAKASTNIPIPTPVLGDFDQQEPATFSSIGGFSWSQTDDSITNGKSTAWIKRVGRDVVEKSSGALLVSGEVNVGYPYPWAGAYVGSVSQPRQSYDISDKREITFEIKGTPGEFRVMLFSSNNNRIPPSQAFIVKQYWQTISLSLANFPNIDTADFSGLAIVAGPAPSKFEYTVDNVRLK